MINGVGIDESKTGAVEKTESWGIKLPEDVFCAGLNCRRNPKQIDVAIFKGIHKGNCCPVTISRIQQGIYVSARI